MPTIETLEKMVRSCPDCRGSGMKEVRTEAGAVVLQDCVCLQRVTWLSTLGRANIPDQYLEYDFADLHQDFAEQNREPLNVVHDYVANLDACIGQGLGLWFYSCPGLGKSLVITAILKEALRRKYRAYMERASHLVTLRFSSLFERKDHRAADLLRYLVDEVDILAIEEIEKVYLVEDAMNYQLFFEFLSDLYDRKKSLLISSNLPRTDVAKKFPTYIQDRLRVLRSVFFRGTSFRARQNKDWSHG